MNWKLFASTYALVFLAELGDKTQIATLSLAASEKAPFTVLAAAALALASTSIIAVLVGTTFGHVIEGPWIRRAAGALFIAMGILFLAGRG